MAMTEEANILESEYGPSDMQSPAYELRLRASILARVARNLKEEIDDADRELKEASLHAESRRTTNVERAGQ